MAGSNFFEIDCFLLPLRRFHFFPIFGRILFRFSTFSIPSNPLLILNHGCYDWFGTKIECGFHHCWSDIHLALGGSSQKGSVSFNYSYFYYGILMILKLFRSKHDIEKCKELIATTVLSISDLYNWRSFALDHPELKDVIDQVLIGCSNTPDGQVSCYFVERKLPPFGGISTTTWYSLLIFYIFLTF